MGKYVFTVPLQQNGTRKQNIYYVYLNCYCIVCSRTLRNDSRQLTSRLHDIFEDNESDIVDESLQSHDYDNISIATTITSSRFANEECMKEAAIGGYLGYFTCHDHKNITEKELKGIKKCP